MSLSSADLKLLNAIIENGHALELAWPEPAANTALHTLQHLIRDLASQAESEDLKRLAFHERNLTDTMSAAHLSGILVPFERLRGRAVREDAFLVTTQDTETRDVAPLTIIADNIRSAFNIGAILRTGEAFGAEAVILSGYSSTPDDPATAKTSLGAENSIAWSHVPKAANAIERLKADGYSIVALETAERAEVLGDFSWPDKTALIVGNERFGIDHNVLEQADHVLKIPLFGKKNSVNIGIALGIALNDWRRTRSHVRAYRPIGLFSASTRHRYEARRQGTENHSDEVGVVELRKNAGFEQALEDLEGFGRVWLIYEFDRNLNWKPKVRPPRGGNQKRGVFATRSPHRPNAIGLSAVELVKVDGRRVYVRGFDLLDQTPILDIKPYLPEADAFPESPAGWTEELKSEAFEVRFKAKADRQVAWLHQKGVTQLRDFLKAQLEYAPVDTDRKRVWPKEQDFVLAYRTWRAVFSLQNETKQVCVSNIHSGYEAADLDNVKDPYQDKDLHRRFGVENFD